MITVTPHARDLIAAAIAEEQQDAPLGLWIEVTGAPDASFHYDVYLQEVSAADPEDERIVLDGIVLVIPASSREALRGATVDAGPEGDLVIDNPNVPRGAEPLPDFGPEALTNDLARRVDAILQEQINPAIAAHGGYAELVGVVDEVAYVLMGGGCQGCGLAAVTLSQGIAVAIRDALPEIRDVVDVTNHAAGNNPYYQPQKK